MVKEINENWANEILKGNYEMKTTDDVAKTTEFIRSNKGFKRKLVFKAVKANSKENNIFCHTIGTHWLTDENGNFIRFVCPEQTQHLKHEGVSCPICEAKRKLIAEGFKEEDLCVQGKYGPVPVFDPEITANMKIVVIESDTNEWDKAHISVLQQNGDFLTKWMIRQYKDNDNPDFLSWDNSNLIKFTRQSDNGKWERGLGLKTFQFEPNVLEKLKKENEDLTMFDLWKMPVDEDFLKVAGVVNKMMDDYRASRDTIVTGTNVAMNSMDDDLPF